MKEQQRHLDAFEIYFKSKQEGSSVTEAIRLVMSKFEVSEKTAFKWKKVFKWDDREAIRSAEINKEVEQRTNSTIVENKTKYLSFYHKLLDNLSNDFKIKIKDVNDLKKVIDGALVLQGESSEISDVKAGIKNDNPVVKEVKDLFKLAKKGNDEDGND